MEAKKPVNVFAAYQQMLNRNKIEPQTAVSTTLPNTKRPSERELKKEMAKEPIRVGQGGAATNRYRHPKYNELTENEVLELNPNLKQTANARFKSPFYNEDSKQSLVKSGIFSTDELAVLAALDYGVKTNKAVQSKFIPVGYVSVGLFDAKGVDIGMVDALVWQCYLGCIKNVCAILKQGYTPQKKYAGFNPITAAIAGRNLQVLKIILKYAPIAEMVNDEDGFGRRAIQVAATVQGIDPFEFAREVINAGGDDRYKYTSVMKNRKVSAAHLCLMRQCCGMSWSPNMFSLILGVTNPWYESPDGESVYALAKRLGNTDAIKMLQYYDRFGEESQNNAITNNKIGY
jgi:hypothetical protein